MVCIYTVCKLYTGPHESTLFWTLELRSDGAPQITLKVLGVWEAYSLGTYGWSRKEYYSLFVNMFFLLLSQLQVWRLCFWECFLSFLSFFEHENFPANWNFWMKGRLAQERVPWKDVSSLQVNNNNMPPGYYRCHKLKMGMRSTLEVILIWCVVLLCSSTTFGVIWCCI